LCLIQVATDDRLAVIDPLAIGQVQAFWELLVSGEHASVVHAGREELIFCHEATGHAPAQLFDLQIGAGLVGLEYPAGYASLLNKLLSRSLHKGETRTDWRRRPLTEHQLEYALDDVRFLLPMYDKLTARLRSLRRTEWMNVEMATWRNDILQRQQDERWRRVSGISGLSPRSLVIVRELWRWREAEAQRRDCPPRRVLRDDLVIELAKRRNADRKQIGAIRGLERGDLKRLLPELADCVERGLAAPEDDLPRFERRETPNQLNLLGQFLSSALTSICRTAKLAPAIVGTASDVRDLISFRLGYGDGEPPLLAQGWRAEIVGQMIDDLLSGRKSIRIADPHADDPLVFEPPTSDAASPSPPAPYS
jgi:ribonuclease D